ncbi:hypothetical protein NIES2107_12170 [Nostoc carneum NIES-2107]|nr:hypothetical protein NIES2107_12170 [Nostoc carneum NIES-2107]
MRFYSHKKRIVASKHLQKRDNYIPNFSEKSGIFFFAILYNIKFKIATPQTYLMCKSNAIKLLYGMHIAALISLLKKFKYHDSLTYT